MGASFAFYIITAAIYSIYACAWVRAAFVFASGSNLVIAQDFSTDWSVLEIHAKYPLVREEALYADYLPVSDSPKELI
jgi:hypothetical protein